MDEKEKHREAVRKWRTTHIQERKEYDKKYYQEHREQRIKNSQEWRDDNRDKIKEWRSRKYWQNKEKELADHKIWVENNRQKSRDIDKNYRERNKEKILNWGQQRRLFWRLQTMDLFGAKCKLCEEDDTRVLQLDHLVGSMRLDADVFGRVQYSRKYFNYIKDNLHMFQILCANCHLIITLQRRNLK